MALIQTRTVLISVSCIQSPGIYNMYYTMQPLMKRHIRDNIQCWNTSLV